MYRFDKGDTTGCVTGVVSESWCRIQVGECSKLAGCHVWASNESGDVWYEAGRSNVLEYSANRIWHHIVGVGINKSRCSWENEGSINGNG